MKIRHCASATLAFWAFGLGACSTGAEYWSSAEAAAVPRATLALQLADYDVVFLGEDHGHAVGHAEHLALVEKIYAVRPDLALSFEQFERDAAPALQAFMAGEATEASFVEAMGDRKWPNYERDYRPMLMFAKAHGLPVIAANVPRKLARKVSKGGADAVADEPLAARELWTPDGAYRDKVADVCAEMGMANEGDSFERFYAAQCLKDCTMAESIADFLASAGPNPPLVIHKNGTFHSDGHLGTVQMLERMRPDLKIAVLTMVSGDEDAAHADFVLRVPVYERPEMPKAHPKAPVHPVADEPHGQNPHEANPHEGNPHGTNPHGTDPHAAGAGAGGGDPPPIDPSGRPALGFAPDYTADVRGCLIKSVTPGGYADRAGLEDGDVIVEMGKLPVDSFEAYMGALGTLDVGGKVEVVVVRGTEEKTFEVTVGSR